MQVQCVGGGRRGRRGRTGGPTPSSWKKPGTEVQEFRGAIAKLWRDVEQTAQAPGPWPGRLAANPRAPPLGGAAGWKEGTCPWPGP